MKRRLKLRHRLVLVAAIGLIPALAVVIVDQLNTRSRLISDAQDYALHMTDVVLKEVLRGMTGAATMMIAMRHTPAVQDDRLCGNYVEGIRADIPSLIDLAIIDQSGKASCHSGFSEAVAVEKHAAGLLADAPPGGLLVGTYVETPSGPALPMGMALPAGSEPGASYVYLNVSLAELANLVGNASSERSGVAMVADRAGTVLMRLPEGRTKPGDKLPPQLAGLSQVGTSGTTFATFGSGARYAVGYLPASGGLPISVFFGLPEEQVLGPVNQAIVTNTAIALAGVVLAVLIAWWVGWSGVERPVNQLVKALAGRRSGDRVARANLAHDGSEIAAIGDELDQLFDELDEREKSQKAAEEQRDIAAREVQHRVKNLLAVIQAIARQTLTRRSSSPEVKDFEGRIDSIARANAALIEGAQPGSTDLLRVVQSAVAPFSSPEHGQIEMRGPALMLAPKAVLALSMVLHELSTNALKYGSLSSKEGAVTIAWSIADETFHISWQESNGPEIGEPDHDGFGMLMIRRVVAAETAGIADLSFEKAGLRFSLAAPVERIIAQV